MGFSEGVQKDLSMKWVQPLFHYYFSDVKRLTLDVIASTVFSYDTDVFNEDDNVFLQQLIQIFKNLDPKQASLHMKLKILLICQLFLQNILQ